jgi:hypothetical protein
VKRLFFPFLASLALCVIGAEEKIPVPGDFAGAVVLGGAEGRLLGIEIPGAVFQGLERADMGDIRVFDSRGLMVPFTLRDLPGRVETPPPEDLPFFPWLEGPSRGLPLNTDIELDSAGTVLRIKNRNGGDENRRAFLLDLSVLSRRPQALRLEMERERVFNAQVILFSSDDLSVWREFNKRQIVAWYGGQAVSRNSIDLPDTQRYLLLRFDRPDIEPGRITALFGETEIPPPPRETILDGAADESRRAVEYAWAGFFPVVSIDFRLAETDSLNLRVKNKLAAGDEWRYAADFTVYRLASDRGGFIRNKPLEIRSAAPFWRIEAKGESFFSSVPQCVIRWTGRELIFLGRGGGPWTLAFGNRDVPPVEAGGLRVDEYLRAGGGEINAAEITGEIRYRPREPGKASGGDWGQWLLWAILIFAVIVLLILAFFTAKSMAGEK